MNKIIELKGNRFLKEKYPKKNFELKLNSLSLINSDLVEKLRKELLEIVHFWSNEKKFLKVYYYLLNIIK